jgi:hypothetical protein
MKNLFLHMDKQELEQLRQVEVMLKRDLRECATISGGFIVGGGLLVGLGLAYSGPDALAIQFTCGGVVLLCLSVGGVALRKAWRAVRVCRSRVGVLVERIAASN